MSRSVTASPRAERGGLPGVLGLLGVLRRKLRVAIATVGLTWLVAYHRAEDLAVLLARPLTEAFARRVVSAQNAEIQAIDALLAARMAKQAPAVPEMDGMPHE